MRLPDPVVRDNSTNGTVAGNPEKRGKVGHTQHQVSVGGTDLVGEETL